MVALAAALCLFLALATGSAALFKPLSRKRGTLEDRIRSLRPAGDNGEGSSHGQGLRKSRSLLPALQRFFERSARSDAIALELRQANVGLRVGEFLLMRWLLAAVAFIVPAVLTKFHPLGLLAAVAVGVLGYLLPGVLLRMRRSRRITRIERQLVEFLPLLASSLRSGFALQQGIEAAARRLGPPLADELALLLSDVNLGATMPAALADLRTRVGSADLDVIVTAIAVQRSTGGNLADVLDKANETLLERERIQGEIQTLTAQQRLTGIILSIYPVAVGLLLLALMPGIWSKLFTETVGQIQLSIAVALQLVGFLAIQRILNVDY